MQLSNPARGGRDGLVLAGILATALATRLWLVPRRWLFADEGPHLMDSKLVVDGLVPVVDFGSRQVLYTFAHAGIVGLFGPDFVAVRSAIALVSVAGALLVFLLAQRLFDRQVGVVAALAYTFWPLGFAFSTQVHTEPWAILFSVLAVYLVATRGEQRYGWRRLVLAGVALGLAVYVRESSLAVGVTIVLFLTFSLRREPRHLVPALGLLGAGFLIPCLLFGIYYSRYLDFIDWWWSPLNPLRLVVWHAMKVAGYLGQPGVSDVATEPAQAAGVFGDGDETTWRYTRYVLMDVAGFSLPLLIGLAASAAFVVRSVGRSDGWIARARRGHLVLWCWIGVLAVLYGYWTVYRGFFYHQYSEEFVPPLAILFGWTFVQVLSRWGFERHVVPAALGFAIYCAVIVALYRGYGAIDVPNYAAFVVPALVLAWVHLPAVSRPRRWMLVVAAVLLWLVLVSSVTLPKPVARALKLAVVPVLLAATYAVTRNAERSRPLVWFGAVSLIATAGGVSYARAGQRMDLAYRAGWSPGDVRAVADFLRAHSGRDDEVMSGGVIWEFQADRHPVATFAHPTALLLSESRGSAVERVEARLRTRPPRFIVMDGITEDTYGTHIANFDAMLQQQYALCLTQTNSRYPVKVYQLRDASPKEGAGVSGCASR
jgi:4-amino-4-deoxy-L-arabinose transferase-like glycosyltransferase